MALALAIAGASAAISMAAFLLDRQLAAAMLQDLPGCPFRRFGRIPADTQAEVEDAEHELLVVRQVGGCLDARFDPQFWCAGGHGPDRLTQQGLDPVLVDGTLAFEDDLVEVGLGGEPVPPAFEAHVPQGPFEAVTHVLD